MFYEAIGAQLGRTAESLAADDPSLPMDERARRERRQTIKLLRGIGAIWPQLFLALDEESAILEATLRSASEAARSNHLPMRDDKHDDSIDDKHEDSIDDHDDDKETDGGVGIADPLARYRGLLLELDALVIRLHERGHEPWAQDTLRSLRRGLSDAAQVQGRLVDDMLAV